MKDQNLIGFNGVITPSSGVISLLMTGRGPLCCFWVLLVVFVAVGSVSVVAVVLVVLVVVVVVDSASHSTCITFICIGLITHTVFRPCCLDVMCIFTLEWYLQQLNPMSLQV